MTCVSREKNTSDEKEIIVNKVTSQTTAKLLGFAYSFS